MKEGGSYIVDPSTGKRVREEFTQDHPEGNCARDKDGNPLDRPAQPEAAPAKPVTQPVAKKSGGK